MNEFKEFDNENYKLKKSDGLRKNGAGIIDAILVIIFQSTLFHYFPELSNLIAFQNVLSFMLFYVLLIFIIYRFITIFILGKTLGMAVLNMKFAKPNQTELSFKEKVLAVLMIYTNTVDCYHLE
ncbi:RDD family protein [Flavobacterium alvei]|uniref:RDD family protein n=1 Tax=Flavobacterium alvei TaxID=2080416 RepID=UPI0026F14553|nr:RDD family protein [Flavobacterium alvei]